MPFLTVAGTTIPVAANSVSRDTLEIGDKARMFDGTYRETIRTRVVVYKGATIPLATSDADAVYAILVKTTQPQSVVGDMLASTSTTLEFFTRVNSLDILQSGSTLRRVIHWEMDLPS